MLDTLKSGLLIDLGTLQVQANGFNLGDTLWCLVLFESSLGDQPSYAALNHKLIVV